MFLACEIFHKSPVRSMHCCYRASARDSVRRQGRFMAPPEVVGLRRFEGEIRAGRRGTNEMRKIRQGRRERHRPQICCVSGTPPHRACLSRTLGAWDHLPRQSHRYGEIGAVGRCEVEQSPRDSNTATHAEDGEFWRPRACAHVIVLAENVRCISHGTLVQ